jgi:hypothetical protein
VQMGGPWARSGLCWYHANKRNVGNSEIRIIFIRHGATEREALACYRMGVSKAYLDSTTGYRWPWGCT